MPTLPTVDQLVNDAVVAAVTAILAFFFGHKHGRKTEKKKNGNGS